MQKLIDNNKKILELCHQRHKKSLQMRKTVITPTLKDNVDYCQFTVYCGHKSTVLLSDLEDACISFRPVGRTPLFDQERKESSGKRITDRQGMRDWTMKRWCASWGIQIYTGKPSGFKGANWHDIEFTYKSICTAPEAVLNCINALINAVQNPLLTLTKSGGLRFSCRVQEYLHPNSEDVKQYIYKEDSVNEDIFERDLYLQIIGEKGMSMWDARYEILLGNILEPPTITNDILFTHIDILRYLLHEPSPYLEKPSLHPIQMTDLPKTLGSKNLDLAASALLKRGFSYDRERNGVAYWTKSSNTNTTYQAYLWERNGIVWIRSPNRNIGLPRNSTPITEVWDDTDIKYYPPDNLSAVQEGKLSPLAIKRPNPILKETEFIEVGTDISNNGEYELDTIYNSGIHILALKGDINSTVRSVINFSDLKDCIFYLNASNMQQATVAERSLQEENSQSITILRPRQYQWDRIKGIPIETRIANPFEHGNVCEYPMSCLAIAQNGVDVNQVFCSKCPVYKDCRLRGYLSQLEQLEVSRIQIVVTPQLFINPKYRDIVNEFLIPTYQNKIVCIIDNYQAIDLFIKCQLSINVIQEWNANWEGKALGNFAKALLNVLTMSDRSYSDSVRRIRATVQGFELLEDEIILQMSHVNVEYTVVPGGINDPDTNKELSNFTIKFEGESFAYIPKDATCADRLRSLGLPIYSIISFVPNEESSVSIRLTEAIEFGILDDEALPTSDHFPYVDINKDWTVWHQLKSFFTHYKLDSNTPIRWDGEVLQFWLPPKLHPSITRLLLTSPSLSEKLLHKAFPDQEIELVRKQPTSWQPGSKLFQIRSGMYLWENIFDFDSNWDIFGISNDAWLYFTRIRTEIDRDPSKKHAIITFKPIINSLENTIVKENVSCITSFNGAYDRKEDINDADVVWIVGTPYPSPSVVWRHAQILYGDVDKPFSFERKADSGCYKDQRVQDVYEQSAIHLLTQIVDQVELDRHPEKTVVLISSLMLPGITDRPETYLFDWEDFEIAGRLDSLAEVIKTRQRYEEDSTKLSAESSREEVIRVLGCSVRQAYRVMTRLRGGRLNTPIRDQILSVLAEGEKKTAELVSAVIGNPTSVKNELKRLVEMNKIVRVQRGVYRLSETVS